jgi:ribose transport system permease protein
MADLRATSDRSSAVGGSEPASDSDLTRRAVNVADLASKYAVIAFLVGLTIVFCVLMPSTFATLGNFQVMVNSQSVILILAIAATVALRVGEFDLSLGNVMTFSAMLLGVLYEKGIPALLAIVIVLGAGLAIGLVNGLIVVRVGVNSLVTTLGMLTILAGLAFALTNGHRAETFPEGLNTFVNYHFLGLPLLTFVGWLLVVIAWYVYEHTPLGRRLLFIGGNSDAARLAGLRVDRLRIGAFVASAGLACVAGIMIAGYLGSIDPGIGRSYLLPPFAAAFLGATTIKTGRYNAWGTLVGLYLLTVGITGLQLLGGPVWVSDVFNGAALIIAVSLGALAGKRND